MNIDQHQVGLENYVKKMFEEIRQSFNLPSPGGSIGVSCDDTVKLDHVPFGTPGEYPRGFYTDLSGQLRIEVISASGDNGMVVYEFAGSTAPSMCDFSTFERLFVRPPGYRATDAHGLPG